jgi:hypothetical protein
MKAMKTFPAAVLFFTCVVSSFAAETNAIPTSPSIAKDSRCFELRTYHAAPGKFEAMHARFRDHACALFKKHGIEPVGFWIPTETDKGADSTLIYILAHKSRDAAKKSWAAFGNDPEWKKAKAESETNGKLVEKSESVFLSATGYSPIR